ncbi:MAG: cell division protein FtsQ/DivIB [Saprospiraceae bacterium]|nr:cell division protein FtsQ/DivIB [Saprospiraceae bacterium]
MSPIRFDLLKEIFVALLWVALAVGTGILSIGAAEKQHHGTVLSVDYDLLHLTDGNDLITVDEIKDKILSVFEFDLVGLEIEYLDIQYVEKVLKDEAFIVDADAYLDRHNVLHIDLKQRTPILRVMDFQGNNYYVDAEGVKLPLSENFTARVPVITGVPMTHDDFDSGKTQLCQVYRLIRYVRNDPFLNAWLEEVHVPREGEMVLIGNIGKFPVIIGDAQELEEKLNKLKVFFQHGQEEVNWNKLESIDLRFATQVVTKRKQ